MAMTAVAFCDVAAGVGDILCKALRLAEKGKIASGTLLVRDLRAGVVNFIDILDRMERSFNIEIPRGELVLDFVEDSHSRDRITFQSVVDYARGKIVKKIIGKALELNPEEIKATDLLVADLHADSSDFLSMGFELEQTLKIRVIKDGKPVAGFDVESLSERKVTVQDVIDYVNGFSGLAAA